MLEFDEVDNDGDGYVECTEDAVGGWDGDVTVNFEDCNDLDVTIFPGAEARCDGQDS